MSSLDPLITRVQYCIEGKKEPGLISSSKASKFNEFRENCVSWQNTVGKAKTNECITK